MHYYRDLTGLTKILGSLLISVFITACADVEKKTRAFDTSLVDSMTFQFESSPRFNNISLPVEAISKQVTSNLQQWGYDFNPEDYSHDLKISMGSINRSSTPFGLSFNAGNSNPRSLDFQKASTFTLTCSLMPKGQDHRAEMIMDVMADSYTDLLNKAKGKNEIIEQLTDDISTVCYNLLSSLNIKTKKTGLIEESNHPTWIPEILIEVEKEIKQETKTRVADDAIVNKIDKKISKTQNKKETRKRIIIHNQGPPVIFKFGSDRL
ncbi:MAG: hypothetical protein L3J59_07515 [Methylococcaceae bacterium]|nr:hypothetical protein [Methylococcaceae bacterium]